MNRGGRRTPANPKSTARRGALLDVSNVRRSTPQTGVKAAGDGGCGCTDRLLLARSKISGIVSQVDEIIAGALQCKASTSKANQEIESFLQVLSEVHSSLEPWTLRLKAAFYPEAEVVPETPIVAATSTATGVGDAGCESSCHEHSELILSPSPLVSWHAETCSLECGKQLFLLTPLPKLQLRSSKPPRSSRPEERFNKSQTSCKKLPQLLPANADDPVNTMLSKDAKEAPRSILKSSVCGAKTALPKSVTFSPLEFSNRKSKPFSVLSQALNLSTILDTAMNNDDPNARPHRVGSRALEISDKSAEEFSQDLAARYPDIFGAQQASPLAGQRKAIATIDWLLSPPKAWLEIEEGQPEQTPATIRRALLATPWRDGESTCNTKKKGETTLKRELWDRFNAASTDGCHLDKSVVLRVSGKGFLDKLEEASAEA